MTAEHPKIASRRDCVQTLLAAVAAGLLPSSGAWASTKAGSGEGFHATPLSADSHRLGFSLTDLDGRKREATSFPGSVLVLFFGFLSCPSICPSTLAELLAARRAMGPKGRQVRVAFATLDPERDTATAMRAWLAHFGDDLVGLRDSPAAIASATRALRLSWGRVPGSQASSYTIDHGVQAYCFDPMGRLRLLLRPGPSPQEIAADWRRLLSGA